MSYIASPCQCKPNTITWADLTFTNGLVFGLMFEIHDIFRMGAAEDLRQPEKV